MLLVAEAAFPRSSPVVLDLAGLSFIDSSGIGALVRLRRRGGGSNESLVIRRLHPRVASRLIRTGLLEFVTVGTGPEEEPPGGVE